jgi:hypothetical protein
MEEEEGLPNKASDLITLLEKLYPDKIVTAEQSPYEQGKSHGIIELIRMLKLKYEKDE